MSNPSETISAATYPLLRVFTPYSTLTHYKGYFVGACPICNGAPTKMVVRPDQGGWHCYSCGAGGDPIDFLQSVEQLSRDQAYLLYKVLMRDDASVQKVPAVASPGARVAAAKPAAPVQASAEPVENPQEQVPAESIAAMMVSEPPTVQPNPVASTMPSEAPELPIPPQTEPVASAPAAERGTLGDLRHRLAAVDGFRGVAYFGTNGKPLLLDGMKGDALTAINAYFDTAFRAAQGVLGAAPDPVMEGVLQDEEGKYIRLDAPVAGSRCRIFLALAAGASEARFRMVVRGFLNGVSTPPQ